MKDYAKNEWTLDLARDFLKEKLLWQGQICQEWRVGKFNGERARPIKIIMPILHDKYIILSKNKFFMGSHLFIEKEFNCKTTRGKEGENVKG